MDKNKKLLIIFGVLLVFLIIFLGINEYRKQQEASQKEIFKEEQSFLVTKDRPEDVKDLKEIENLANFFLINSLKEDNKIRDALCLIINPGNKDSYSNSFLCSDLSSVENLIVGQYASIAVNLNDVIAKVDSDHTQREFNYFCGISRPYWQDPLLVDMQERGELVFPEGNISCSYGLNMDKEQNFVWIGNIPNSQSLSLKVYLVGEDKRNEVLSSQSFQEAQDILNSEQLIWQREKPILSQ